MQTPRSPRQLGPLAAVLSARRLPCCQRRRGYHRPPASAATVSDCLHVQHTL